MNQADSSTSPVPTPVDNDVEVRLLYAAYERKPTNLLLTVVGTLSVGALLLQVLPTAPMLAWMVAVLASAALGTLEWRAFRRAAPAAPHIRRWQHLFLAQAASAGAAWALGPTLMMAQAGGAKVALLVVVMLCVCAVATISVAEQLRAMQAFIAAALMPPALALWSVGGDIERMVSVVMVLAMALLMVVGRHSNSALRRLLHSQARTQAMLDTALDAVITMDANGMITAWNLRAESMFGWSRTEALGRNLGETMVPQQHREAHRNGLARFLESGEEHVLQRRIEITAVRRNGDEFPIELAITSAKTAGSVEFTAFISDITERKRAANALEESEARHRTLIDWSPTAIGVHRGGIMLYVNPAAVTMFGASGAHELVGKPILARIHPDYHQIVLARVQRYTQDGVSAPMMEEKFIKLDGSVIDVEVQGTSIIYDGEPAVRVAMRDVTERKLADAELRIAATAFESQQGMTVTNAQQIILRVNAAFTEITGYTPQEVVGKTPRVLSSGRHDKAFYTVLWECIKRTGTWQGEIWNRRKSGEVFPEWLTITAVKDETATVTHYVATSIDISARKTAEDQIRSLAFYDPLTGLPNRRLLMDRLAQSLTAGSRHHRKGALLFVDLDNFKTINDTLGHYQGDLLLEQVAHRLSTCIREGDTVARLGGDEFVVMLEDLSESVLEAATQAETVGEKILSTLNQIYQLGPHEHHSTPSIGVTLFGVDPHEPLDEPLKRADLAMYQAKAAGRNTLRFFDPQMQAVVMARAALEAGLREAVQQAQFVLHYQAQVGDGRLMGVEALVRWQHPQRGLVPPLEFIPLAEETGLIVPLGQWVLQTACEQLAAWAQQPEFEHLTIAVNVSERQFRQADFVPQVLTTLARTGADPRHLTLELTESLLVTNVEDVIAKMNLLKAQGVGFSLDDFGTGYSSLSYLKRLPLDQLKIDQGFVRDILIDANDAAISGMVIVLAQSLGLKVIAEGVESEAQRAFLARQGCHAYQGYLFSRPLALQQFEAFARLALHSAL